jgi:hypothetical protein
MIKKCVSVLMQSPGYSYQIFMNIQFSLQISEKYSKVIFH